MSVPVGSQSESPPCRVWQHPHPRRCLYPAAQKYATSSRNFTYILNGTSQTIVTYSDVDTAKTTYDPNARMWVGANCSSDWRGPGNCTFGGTRPGYARNTTVSCVRSHLTFFRYLSLCQTFVPLTQFAHLFIITQFATSWEISNNCALSNHSVDMPDIAHVL